VFQKFLRLLAGRVGQLINFQSLSNDVGVSQPTIREWIIILEASYILFKLPPFHENISKRLIKSPKIYFFDTGLVSYLIGVESSDQLKTHHLRGLLFENMIIAEMVKNRLHLDKENNFLFYRDSNGVEVDLVVPLGSAFDLYEIKASSTVTQSFFKNLKKVEKHLGQINKKHLIYAGELNTVQPNMSRCHV